MRTQERSGWRGAPYDHPGLSQPDRGSANSRARASVSTAVTYFRNPDRVAQSRARLNSEDSGWLRKISEQYLRRKEPKTDCQSKFTEIHSIRRSRRLESNWVIDNGRLFLAPTLGIQHQKPADTLEQLMVHHGGVNARELDEALAAEWQELL